MEGPFPHSKTRLNNQGVKSPFITIFKRDKIIGKTNSLVSAIDITPTILEYAGIKIGDNYQGKSFKNLLENRKIHSEIMFLLNTIGMILKLIKEWLEV